MADPMSRLGLALGSMLLIGGCSMSGRAPTELVGIWDLISTDSGGGAIPRTGTRMVITERSIEMVAPSGARKVMGEIAGTHLMTTPKGIDLSNGGSVGRGIYEVTGDELKLIVCDPSQPRPSEFKGHRQGMLFVLKRHR
jgi:uncharacterized protein (TIGR03067 family)